MAQVLLAGEVSDLSGTQQPLDPISPLVWRAVEPGVEVTVFSLNG